ncbi:MarR family transcriptional regulator [Roseovarius spongiae]|uniref:MarR family transcriptional regulator n=1 Tax=Roseovarius spongiae TaxID=2320272 RepID=A0A3A8B341_9RHOB|nr:MarR family winged helix-turn-helix transcriptional regulator [Roseovarius spongiae]RKF14762.1 MarR family transcriptional regulator [Roseovarius spongiae]
MQDAEQIRSLINRLARLDAAGNWGGALNPAQRAALEYLARANRFSRSPSHVADYLGATRGTTSQTLKALMRKGFVDEQRLATDRRSISYRVTEAGREIVGARSLLSDALADLPEADLALIAAAMRGLLGAAIRRNGAKPFGVCQTCRHFRRRGAGGYCALMDVALDSDETDQLCHEHAPA